MAYDKVFLKTNWLNAASSNTTTSAEDVSGTGTYGLAMSTTGGPTSGSIVLQGTVDGTNYVELASVNIGIAGASARIVWATDKPVKEVRLDLSGLSGGSSPTLSASVIAI